MPGNRMKDAAADQTMLDGCNKRLTALATVPVGGVQMKPADILGKVQTRIDAGKALDTEETAFHKAVQKNKDTRAQTAQFMLDLRAAIRVLFGTDIVALGDFGLEPPKARVKKPAVLVAAATKAKATRAVRGTKGKKARLAITAPAPQAEPVTPPAAPIAPTPANKPQ